MFITPGYLLEHLSVISGSIAGVLAATGKRVDLFGAIVLGLVTATGGGTLRDVVLDVPVFWIRDGNFLATTIVAAVATFIFVRYAAVPHRLLMFADAVGLAFVTIVGTSKAMDLNHGPLICIVLGVTTGVAGGILRDVLCRELPHIFQTHVEWYATTAFCGACVYLLLNAVIGKNPVNLIVGSTVILTLRLAAMHWRWKLPELKTREQRLATRLAREQPSRDVPPG